MTPSKAICDLLVALAGIERELADARTRELHHQREKNAATQDRDRLAARSAKTLAVLLEQIRHEATGEPVSPSSRLVGTPALELCPGCNGGGCPSCNGRGVVRGKGAAETELEPEDWARLSNIKRQEQAGKP